jgi:hypothetical protein
MEENQRAILEKAEEIRQEYVAKPLDRQEEEQTLIGKINDLMVTIFGDDSISLDYLLSEEKLTEWKKNRWRKYIPTPAKLFMAALLITITCFLVSEAVTFYAINGEITVYTYFKAILTEVCFIFLGGYVAKGSTERIGVTLLRVAMFCLMLFVITSETFMNSTKTVEYSNVLADQVRVLETQIAEKQKVIDFYAQRGWGISTNRHMAEKQKLYDELKKLKDQQMQGSNEKVSEMVRYKAYGNALFRVLLLFISLLISRRLFRF